MGEISSIAWTTSTFNPWADCSKVSPGCANCYAERSMFPRLHGIKWSRKTELILVNTLKWGASGGPFIFVRFLSDPDPETAQFSPTGTD